jgi:hypothetical protein
MRPNPDAPSTITFHASGTCRAAQGVETRHVARNR